MGAIKKKPACWSARARKTFALGALLGASCRRASGLWRYRFAVLALVVLVL